MVEIINILLLSNSKIVGFEILSWNWNRFSWVGWVERGSDCKEKNWRCRERGKTDVWHPAKLWRGRDGIPRVLQQANWDFISGKDQKQTPIIISYFLPFLALGIQKRQKLVKYNHNPCPQVAQRLQLGRFSFPKWCPWCASPGAQQCLSHRAAKLGQTEQRESVR